MMPERLRTAVIVTIVTALVWLFAESRTLRIETLTIPVTIVEGGKALVYRHVGEDWPGVVEIEIAGPTGQIGEIRAAALDAGVTLELGDELPADPGVRTIDLREALRLDDLFLDSGVTIQRVTPEAIQIEIDRLESISLPVGVDLAGIETVGPVTVTPAEVTVSLPATIARDLNATATARIDPARLSALTPGRRAEIGQVPIRSLGIPESAWGLRFEEPRLVSVSLTLRARTSSVVVPELPVYVGLRPADLAAWVIEIPPEDRILSNVTLTGPDAVIEQIRRGDVPLTASVRLTTDDLARGVQTAPVEILGLPPGVVADLSGRTVRINAVRRTVQPEG